MIVIQEIRIESRPYINEGALRGRIRLSTEHGTVEVELTEPQMQALCVVAREVALEVVKQVAAS